MLARLQELFDQIKDTLAARWEQFQETETYQNLKEKYDSLSPVGQKLVVGLFIGIISLMLLMIPWGWYTTSQQNVTAFEDTKATINELLAVSQESKTLPPQSQTLSGDAIKAQIDKILSEKGLTKEQLLGSNERQFTNPKGSNLIPSNVKQNGVEVSLRKLNLKQLVDIGYDFEKISGNVKILGLEIRANPEDNHYYDVNYHVAGFAVEEKKAETKKKR